MAMAKKRDTIITTIIGKGAECDGDFTAEGSVRIDGSVDGFVNVTGDLIVGATGHIEGNVTAHSVIVGGEIIGDIEAQEKVEMTATARVIGDIRTTVIVIDENAVFQGGCNMNQEVPLKKQKLPRKVLRAGKKSAKAAIAEALREVAEQNKAEDTAEDKTEEKPVAEEQNTSKEE